MFRIGIDLGTTNCALAWIREDGGRTAALEIAQAETGHSEGSHPTLPSFLYLPPGTSKWLAGRWAKARAAEVPGRVVSSAKSWMVHHAADRHARFLPLGTGDLAAQDLISPVQALAILLRILAEAWDEAHPEALLAAQEVAITVPASFDPAAQQLTLEAARDAGFPESAILLEEPQAAFYAWMERSPEGFSRLAVGKPSHVLVVDIGGGTTDLSLFAVDPGGEIPHLSRIAVSDHLLLGGDNLDLSLSQHLESRLLPDGQLPAATFAHLLARCREIKEEALGAESEPSRMWPVAVARPGASLLAGTLRSKISAHEVSRLLLEGFFPAVGARETPDRAASGLREMGLPYAKDPAVTRHLAEFLHGRPPVDYLLFNGGLTKAPAIRRRILENIAGWQDGHTPRVLENPQPDLAVACGAARFLHLRGIGDVSRIEAGAAHSYYVGVGGEKLLCVLPLGAPTESSHLADLPELRALVGKPASFPLYQHARRPQDLAGDLVSGSGFGELPAVESVLAPPPGSKPPKDPKVRVKLRTTLRSTGLLRIELLCAEPSLKWAPPWPLEFSLRGRPAASPTRPAQAKPAGHADAVSHAAAEMASFLNGTRKWHEKLTANAVFSIAEKTLSSPKPTWSGGIVRQLFDAWIELSGKRTGSAAQEETWLQIAGYLLRPGCGMAGDSDRVEALAQILTCPPVFPGGSVKIQRWIAARRIAAGLDTAHASAIWTAARSEWREGGSPSAEIALLAGSLESLPVADRLETAGRLAKSLESQPQNSAFWKGLGRLLSRVLFHGGAEMVLPPEAVVAAWESLRSVEVPESIRPEAAAAWLRAARLTGLRPLDVPKSCRSQISSDLRSWGTNDMRRRVLENVVPVVASDQAGLLGESPPPGLSLAEG